MKNNNNRPKLRFPGFTDPWEQRKLDEIAEFSKGQGYSKNDLSEVGTPIILYGRLYTRYQSVISDVDTFVLEKSCAIYSKGNEVIVPASGESSEDIARASAVIKSGILLGGDLNIIYPNDTISSVFLALSISNGQQQKELSKKAQGKSVVHLHNSDLKEVELLYPTREEQVQIGKFFGKLDHRITLNQRKLNHLQDKKKSLLQKMFPKNGEDFPELRFPGFTDAWEQRKAGDIFFTVVDKNHPQLPILSASQEFGMIKRDDSGINISHNTENEVGYKKVMPGQFVIHLRSFQGGFAHSSIEGITSPAYTVIDFVEKSNHYDHFWKYIFNSKFFINTLELITYGIRDGRSISYKDFVTLPFKFTQYEEQKKIGDFFVKLDNFITLNQRKLNHLQEQKKALLQHMFV
ncbi:restriction endonuclease subunit S [Clostridium estertheticum]|uniref:restriction endonuclease subunit S n=1 Tax=Clostridium estertheticum TaxID=238834 RepID=UPI001CF1BF03|nr:restriction endonuclease subunit S [Clostridium estertheticum]MCB2361588.1 restriction endonuclease subunit S [Clostridium estertheticum]